MGGSGSAGAAAATCFWTGFLSARLLAPFALRHIAPATAILAGLAGLGLSGAAMIAALLSGTASVLIAASGVAGLGLGAVFPTAVAIFCDFIGPAAARSANLVFACGALGGATVPLATGWAVSRSGDVRAGIAIVIGGTAAMLRLQVGIARHAGRAQHRKAAAP
jgi:fucose permease